MLAARATLVLAAAFVLAGAAFDSPSMYVPGVALALLVAGTRVWVGAAARRARLEPQRGPWAIEEGEPYPLELVIRGDGCPLPGGRVVHPLADRPAGVGGRSPARVRVRLRPRRRGRWELEPARLQLADPLRLHTAELQSGPAGSVLVLPRIEPVIVRKGRGGGRGNGLLDGLEGNGATGLDTRPIDFELDGLRPYRQGSPASRIHWPTVARTGEMLEHRLVAGANASPLVVLDSSQPSDLDALDRAVRAAASLCVHLAPSRGCALLLVGDRAPRQIDRQLHAWPRAHARLAVVQAGGSPPAVRRTPSASVVFWVTASRDVPVERLLPGGAGYLVSAGASPGPEPAFSVAGCDGQRLGAWRRRPLAEAAPR
jgi:uncharacterized protein (DUF58 family)